MGEAKRRKQLDSNFGTSSMPSAKEKQQLQKIKNSPDFEEKVIRAVSQEVSGLPEQQQDEFYALLQKFITFGADDDGKQLEVFMSTAKATASPEVFEIFCGCTMLLLNLKALN